MQKHQKTSQSKKKKKPSKEAVINATAPTARASASTSSAGSSSSSSSARRKQFRLYFGISPLSRSVRFRFAFASLLGTAPALISFAAADT